MSQIIKRIYNVEKGDTLYVIKVAGFSKSPIIEVCHVTKVELYNENTPYRNKQVYVDNENLHSFFVYASHNITSTYDGDYEICLYLDDAKKAFIEAIKERIDKKEEELRRAKTYINKLKKLLDNAEENDEYNIAQ